VLLHGNLSGWVCLVLKQIGLGARRPCGRAAGVEESGRSRKDQQSRSPEVFPLR
jgi:hypothetical protein